MRKKITSFFIVFLCLNLAQDFLLPNFFAEAKVPNDYYYQEQWYLEKIKAPQAWDKISNSSDIVIAIIDSGVQIDHPDLVNNIWQNQGEIPDNGIDDDKNGFMDDYNGWDFVNNSPDPRPKFEAGFTSAGILHGTIVAGIIAGVGDNKIGISGLNWETNIMPLRALDDKGEGKVMSVVRAIDYAINNGANIINLSFFNFEYSQTMYEAIARAHKAGVIIVAAAGRGESYNLDINPMYPICYDGSNGENMVIGVAATDSLDQKTDFSSYGFDCIDITAPGVSIFSTTVYEPTKYYEGEPFVNRYDGYWNGTSYATPLVSGSLALIKQINPGITREEAIDALLSTTDDISRLNPNFVGQLGTGRLNLAKAVNKSIGFLNSKNLKLLIAPYSNHSSLVKIMDYSGQQDNEFYSYGENFLGGSQVVAGDINGDGQDEIISGAGSGGGPHVRIFDSAGKVVGQFFAYNKNFRGGVNVAAGDVNGDGVDEIITGIGPGGGSQIRIFDSAGNILNQFFAYNNNFRGGVNVAVGDVNGDGMDEIVTGAGNGSSPQVRVFDSAGNILNQFFAYNENFRGGVNVAVADTNGGTVKKKSEIITGAGNGGGPHIRIFEATGNVLGQFFAYNENFRGGVSVAAGDLDNDGLAEIVTGAGPGGAPHVRAFESSGQLIGSFYAYEEEFNGGVNVGIVGMRK